MDTQQIDTLLNIYSLSNSPNKDRQLLQLLKNISVENFKMAINSEKYEEAQINILKNLLNQKLRIFSNNKSNKISKCNLLSLQSNTQIDVEKEELYNALRNIIININGNNKESNKIITSLFRLILDDQKNMKDKQNEVIKCLTNYKNNSANSISINKLAQLATIIK